MKIIVKEEDNFFPDNPDEYEYTITEEVTKQLIEFLLEKMYTMYEKTPNTLQMAVTMFVRNELLNLEKKYPEKKESFRPAKREDPVKHVLHLAKGVFAEVLKEVKVHVKANGNSEIYTVEFENPGEGRGPLVARRDFGLGQDDSSEISR